MQGADKGQSGSLEGDGLSIGIVRARFNDAITTRLAEAAAAGPVPLLPGVATAGEAMAMAEMGHHVMKVFPAEPAGGDARPTNTFHV